MNRRSSVLAYLAVCVSVFAVPALSSTVAVVYSNFGAGSSYDTSLGNPVGNAFDGNDYAEGGTFVLSGDAVFSSLRIALSCFAFCPDPFSVTLNRDAGNQPGAPLETFAVPSGVLGSLGSNNPPLLLNSVLNTALTPATRYWITVSADLNDSIAWNLNSISDSAAEAISIDGRSTWFSPSGNTPGAFEVSAIVPEPASLGLVLGAGVLLGLLRLLLSSNVTES